MCSLIDYFKIVIETNFIEIIHERCISNTIHDLLSGYRSTIVYDRIRIRPIFIDGSGTALGKFSSNFQRNRSSLDY